jgi:hypothetical protein
MSNLFVEDTLGGQYVAAAFGLTVIAMVGVSTYDKIAGPAEEVIAQSGDYTLVMQDRIMEKRQL